MKKVVKMFLLVIFTFITLAFTTKVNASSATFSVKSSASTVAVGNNVTVTVTLSSGTALGSWNFTIGYDTSKLKLVSSTAERDQTSAGFATSANQKSVSYKYTFKALQSGTATVNIGDAIVYDFSEEKMSLSKGSTKITLKTWAQIEAGYSTNADLKSITIDGGELNPNVSLTPEFNKNTLEYTIELEPDTTEITVSAAEDDSKSSVNGTGKISVSEGSNKIEIVVTAQKGNTKTYVINAIVKELEPINVTIDGTNYTVIRKAENMTNPYSYTEDTVMINELEVPAFYSSITGYKLVGLKDETGNIKMFIYNESNGTYKYYQELSLNKVLLATLSIPEDKIIKGYTKDKVMINNEEVECIKNEEFGITLVYGKNVETGKSLFYVYDAEENTLQRYDEESFDRINNKFELYTYIILGAGSVIILLIIILIASMIKNKKKLKIRKEEMKNSLVSVDKENMALLETPSKKERKEKEKEIKRKQKELEALEKKTQQKLMEQEKNNIKENKKQKKKEKKHSEEETQEELKPVKEESPKLQEFQLETTNEKIDKKKKRKIKKEDEDDNMFLL